MIKDLHIKNYKSIKEISLKPKRINVFIGEHNSGKSNILEALSWFSVNALDANIFKHLFRFKNVSNFFYNFDSSQTIEVTTDDLSFKLRFGRNGQGAIYNNLEGIIFKNQSDINDKINWVNNTQDACYFTIPFEKDSIPRLNGSIIQSTFKTYIFKRLDEFRQSHLPYLNPPFGENIPNLLLSNKELKQMVSDFFKSKGYRIMQKPVENDIEMAKDVNDELYSFPYITISETMQRYVFGMLAIKSNTNSVLILDEPETNMFPFFVKDFSESIADDSSNQFFITTHNPFMLNSLLEKTPKEELAVFITTMKDYQTQIQQCSQQQIDELASLGSSALFNLDNITAE